MKQTHIVKAVIGAFVNSPASRLKQMTPEAFVGISDTKLESLISKLETMLQICKNQQTIRKNFREDFADVCKSTKIKEMMLKASKKGNIRATL